MSENFKDGNFKTNRQQPVAAVFEEATGKPRIVSADTNGIVGVPSQMLRWNPATGEWEKWDALPDDYWKQATLGNIPGDIITLVGGENPDIEPNGPEHIWYQGGLRTYLTTDTDLYVSSSSALDVGQSVIQAGLDSNLDPTDGIATLNGQNQVKLDSQFFRLKAFFNIGPGELNGDVYVAEADTLTGGVPDTPSKIKLKCPAGLNLATNADFTVRKDHIAYVTSLEGTVGKSKSAKISIGAYSPTFGLNFQIAALRLVEGKFNLGNTTGISFFGPGDIINVIATTDDPATPVTAHFKVVEVPIV